MTPAQAKRIGDAARAHARVLREVSHELASAHRVRLLRRQANALEHDAEQLETIVGELEESTRNG